MPWNPPPIKYWALCNIMYDDSHWILVKAPRQSCLSSSQHPAEGLAHWPGAAPEEAAGDIATCLSPRRCLLEQAGRAVPAHGRCATTN